MTLKGAPVIRWTNRNIKDIEGTNIYRSVNTPLNPNALPDPHDFQQGNQAYYVDYDVSNYNTYYYMIGVFDKGEEKISNGMVEIGIGKDLMKPVNITSEYHRNNTDDTLDSPVNITSDYQGKSYSV